MKNKLWILGGVLAVGIVCYFIYELCLVTTVIVMVNCGFCFFIMNGLKKRAKQNEERFSQVSAYLEQLLLSFKRCGQILPSLEDCQGIFHTEDIIYGKIVLAIEGMKTGEGIKNGNITKQALAQIEKEFPSRRLAMTHKFLMRAEQTGGMQEHALDILLEDLQLWRERTQLDQKKRNFMRTEMVIATVLAGIMCYISKLLTPGELGFSLEATLLYQVATAIVLVGFLWTLVLVWKKLTLSWLDIPVAYDDKKKEHILKQYEIMKGICPANGLAKHLAHKICKRTVMEEFPYWLLAISLVLQTDSVLNAISQSSEDVSPIMQRELQCMLTEIYEKPVALEPYLHFFEQLAIPEVHTGMKILYSVNQNGYEDSVRQLDFLISQNNRLMDQSEKNQFANKTAGLGLMKTVPMLIACIKLLADLVNLLRLTMGTFSNMV